MLLDALQGIPDSGNPHAYYLFATIEAGSERSVGKPMTYEYYHKVIKGIAPKNAPTYQAPERSRKNPPKNGSAPSAAMCTVIRILLLRICR